MWTKDKLNIRYYWWNKGSIKQNQKSLREEKYTKIVHKSLQKKTCRDGLLKVSNISCIEAGRKERERPFMIKFMEKVTCEVALMEW